MLKIFPGQEKMMMITILLKLNFETIYAFLALSHILGHFNNIFCY